jgi:hypothetical protein
MVEKFDPALVPGISTAVNGIDMDWRKQTEQKFCSPTGFGYSSVP